MADPLSALRAATGQSPDQTGSDLPSIPAVPLTSSPHETNFLASVKSWLEKAAGTAGFVSRRDLASYGVIQANSDGTFGPVVPPNKSVPPAPTNLQATGAMTNIILDWDDPNAAYGNHAFTEVWASETISFSTAVMVGQSAGFNFAHAVGAGSTRYYWIRFVSTSDVKGPYNDVGGTVANTSNDPAWLLSVLNNQITEDQLYTTLNTRIDLIDAASSVAGSVNARVQAVQDVVNDFLIAPDWLIGTTYAIGDMVVYSGKLYRALRTTVGDQPNTSALDWQLIGDYTSLGATVAGHTTDIATLVTDLGAEVTARTVLAAGVATKRSIFRQGTAPASAGLNAGDLWIDTSSSYATDFFAADYASIRHKMYQWSGTDWVDSTDDQIYDNAAAIVTEQSVRADADNAIAVDLTALTSRVGTAESSLVTEQTTRASADTALASRATALEATVNSGTDGNTALKARIASEETARASADTALASRATALEATVNSGTDGNTALKARIVSEETARASGDSANASSITAVQARLDSGGDISNAIVLSQTTASTGVTNAATAQTTANSKVKTFFQTSAPTASTTGDLWVDTDDNNHIYRWSGSAWADAHDARITSTASQVTTIQTTVDGHTTSIATNATSIDGVKAQYTVKIDNNGVMSGYGLSSDLIAGTGVLSKFIASVDQFAVVAPNRTAGQLNSVPFAVLTTSQTINGVSFAPGVYIDGASINSGTIGTAQIANAAIDTAKIADASIVTAKIGDAQINSAKIQDAAIITAKINDAAITTAKINDASIVTAKINDAAITTAKIGTAQITTALISNAAITNAKIGDAQIDTLKVAGNSITVSASATATLAYTASTSVALSFVQAPQSVVLLVRVSTDLASSASATAPTVTLKRNGTTIASRTVSPVVVSEYYSLSPVATGYDVVWLVYDTPPTAGTFTYTFANDGGGPSSRTVYIDILALGTMR